MPPNRRVAAIPAAVLVIVALALVHVQGAVSDAIAQAPQQKSTAKSPAATSRSPVVRYGTAELPQPVLEMREAILAAVHSGNLEDLRVAVELNEMKPAISDKPEGDPIAYWRRISKDGEGRDILAVLAEVLDAGYVTLPIGKDIENNRVYVWPYFAEMPLDRLSPGQEVELLRLVPVDAFNLMKKEGRYSYYKLGIGADGVWHFFIR